MYGLQKLLLDPEESVIVKSKNQLIDKIGEEKIIALMNIVPEPADQRDVPDP